jgi:RNA polymerase sigma factor (sigma-70 family)
VDLSQAAGALVTRTQAETRDEFAALVRPHWAQLASLARRLAPPGQWEDVLQEALSAAWRKRRQFDQSRGSARTWLFAIVADQAYKGHRRTGRPLGQLLEVTASGADSVDSGAATGAGVDVRRLLARLSRRQRVAIELYYYLGLPVDEVAAVMQCSPGTVKSTLSDARARLRRELGEDYR